MFSTHPETGELVRVGGSFVRVTGEEEILQAVRCRWRIIRGEVILAPSAGADWIGLLQEGTPSQRIEQALAEEALAVPGVVAAEIGELTLDAATRRGSVEASLLADLGDQRRRVRLSDTFTRRAE
jgi:hypothetical protein